MCRIVLPVPYILFDPFILIFTCKLIDPSSSGWKLICCKLHANDLSTYIARWWSVCCSWRCCGYTLSHTKSRFDCVVVDDEYACHLFSLILQRKTRAYLTHLHGAWQNATGVPKTDAKAVQLPKLVYGGKAKVYLVLFLQWYDAVVLWSIDEIKLASY